MHQDLNEMMTNQMTTVAPTIGILFCEPIDPLEIKGPVHWSVKLATQTVRQSNSALQTTSELSKHSNLRHRHWCQLQTSKTGRLPSWFEFTDRYLETPPPLHHRY